MNDPTEKEEEDVVWWERVEFNYAIDLDKQRLIDKATGIGLAPLCAHPAVSEFQSIVSARKNMRCALDGHLYTINEFQAYYGEAAAESIWQSAPHFIQLREFCGFFNLWLDSGSGPEPLESSSALFGLWVPGWLVLVDVHHLEGKLKGSRLAPKGWHPDIWEAAWHIGPTGNRMMVLDLCTELLGSIHPLGKVGRKDMKNILKEFSQIMDGAFFDQRCLTTNLLMSFLSVDPSSILACCEVGTPPPPMQVHIQRNASGSDQ